MNVESTRLPPPTEVLSAPRTDEESERVLAEGLHRLRGLSSGVYSVYVTGDYWQAERAAHKLRQAGWAAWTQGPDPYLALSQTRVLVDLAASSLWPQWGFFRRLWWRVWG